LLKKKLDKL